MLKVRLELQQLKYQVMWIPSIVQLQVLEERIYHIEYVPECPEPYYKSSGKELQPRPVGEENGIVIYNYNPVSAVNYVSAVHVQSSFPLTNEPAPF